MLLSLILCNGYERWWRVKTIEYQLIKHLLKGCNLISKCLCEKLEIPIYSIIYKKYMILDQGFSVGFQLVSLPWVLGCSEMTVLLMEIHITFVILPY